MNKQNTIYNTIFNDESIVTSSDKIQVERNNLIQEILSKDDLVTYHKRVYQMNLDELDAILTYGDHRAYYQTEYSFEGIYYGSDENRSLASHPLQNNSNNLNNIKDISTAKQIGGFQMSRRMMFHVKRDFLESRKIEIINLFNRLPIEFKRTLEEIKQCSLDKFIEVFSDNYKKTRMRLLAPLIVETARKNNLLVDIKQICDLLSIDKKGYIGYKQRLIESGFLDFEIIRSLKQPLISSANTKFYQLIQNNLITIEQGQRIKSNLDIILSNEDLMYHFQQLRSYKDTLVILLAANQEIDLSTNKKLLASMALKLNDNREDAKNLILNFNRFCKDHMNLITSCFSSDIKKAEIDFNSIKTSLEMAKMYRMELQRGQLSSLQNYLIVNEINLDLQNNNLVNRNSFNDEYLKSQIATIQFNQFNNHNFPNIKNNMSNFDIGSLSTVFPELKKSNKRQGVTPLVNCAIGNRGEVTRLHFYRIINEIQSHSCNSPCTLIIANSSSFSKNRLLIRMQSTNSIKLHDVNWLKKHPCVDFADISINQGNIDLINIINNLFRTASSKYRYLVIEDIRTVISSFVTTQFQKETPKKFSRQQEEFLTSFSQALKDENNIALNKYTSNLIENKIPKEFRDKLVLDYELNQKNIMNRKIIEYKINLKEKFDEYRNDYVMFHTPNLDINLKTQLISKYSYDFDHGSFGLFHNFITGLIHVINNQKTLHGVYTSLSLSNAAYFDNERQIQFNQKWTDEFNYRLDKFILSSINIIKTMNKRSGREDQQFMNIEYVFTDPYNVKNLVLLENTGSGDDPSHSSETIVKVR